MRSASSGPSSTFVPHALVDGAAVGAQLDAQGGELAAQVGEARDRHARADEEAPVQREIGDGVGGGEAPVVEVRVHDLEAVRDPIDAAASSAALMPARGASAKPNMISGSRRGCTRPAQRDASCSVPSSCVRVVSHTGPQIGACTP